MKHAHVISLTVTLNTFDMLHLCIDPSVSWQPDFWVFNKTGSDVALNHQLFTRVLAPVFNTGYIFVMRKWVLQTHLAHPEIDPRNGVVEQVRMKCLIMSATPNTVCFPFVGFNHKIVKWFVFVLFFFCLLKGSEAKIFYLFFPMCMWTLSRLAPTQWKE